MDIRLHIGRRLAVGAFAVGLGVLGVPVAQAAPVQPTSTYLVQLRGSDGLPIARRLSQNQAGRLASDPSVAYVVADTPVHALGEQPNPPSWGLDRIDQRRLPLDHLYRFPNTADNVNAYVIDTGVRASHVDIRGRVSGGVDIVDNDGNPDDGNGHGTFIAGIIGGTQFGVAKKIHIVPVRVLDNNGSGSTANVIAGIRWVIANVRKPAVINMSLGGSANQALDDAVRAAIAAGITFVVPSGSSASDAGNFSPARVREAITTSASRIDDCVFPPSNFGPLIDLYAPGANITSIWATSDTATITISGTSFSTPHVVGGAALYLATHPSATPAEVANALITASTKGILCNVPANTPNRLLYTGP